LEAAHKSNLVGISAGQHAQRKATTRQVQELGARLVTDHNRLDDAVRQTAVSLTVDLLDTPNQEQQAAAAQLDAASGEDYDALWLSLRMDAYMQDMANVRLEMDRGEDPAVKTAAQNAARILGPHGELIEAAGRDIGVPGRVDEDADDDLNTSSDRMLPMVLLGLGIVLVVSGGLLVRFRLRR
jgi:putative membrane protein